MAHILSVGPSTVTVRGVESPISAGRKHRVICEARGSRPPATLSWWLDGTQMHGVSQMVSKY